MSNRDNLKNIKVDLEQIIGIVCRLEENGFAQIEKDLALQKLRTVYEDFHSIKEEIYPDDIEKVESIEEELIDGEEPGIEVEIVTGEGVPEGEVLQIEKESYEAEIKPEPLQEEKDSVIVEEKEDALVLNEQEEELFEMEKVEENTVNEVEDVQDEGVADQQIDEPIEEVKEPVAEEKTNESPKEEKKPLENGNGQKTVADQFQSQQQSLNDIAAINNKVRDLASQLKDQPIDDLKKAINLNDRFLFTKELFEGNAEKYNTSIEELNGLKDLDEAMEYINSRFSWDMEKESFKRFIELIYRRYIPVNQE